MSEEDQLSSVDIRLLRRFMTVVEAGGITAACRQLEITQSTLSNQLATLERNLGMALCRRGRGGFRLTEEGLTVYRSAERLLGALTSFGNEAAAARGELRGVLTIGIVDNIVTNEACRLAEAIASFSADAPDVRISVRVSTPDDLESGVTEANYSIAIVPFRVRDTSLNYDFLFDEEQGLFCGRGHPLYNKTDFVDVMELNEHSYAGRGYFDDHSLPIKPSTVAWDMEAVAILALSGKFIGHLPLHYAQRWMNTGDLTEISGERFRYISRFVAARKRQNRKDPLIDRFASALIEVHSRARC